MDSWSNEQVEVGLIHVYGPFKRADRRQNMKKIGNVASNKAFNPRNAKPAIPMDIDEVDGVLERFVRAKYEKKALGSESQPSSRAHRGSTSSDGDPPPMLPPKPQKRFHFGLRAASSTLPVSRNQRSPPVSPDHGYGRDPSPPPRNKPARVFGADVGGSRDDNLKGKLAALKDMGFPDERRNTTILKGLNGDVERAVEELVRLGEGGRKGKRLSKVSSNPTPHKPNGLSVDKGRSGNADRSNRTSENVVNHNKSLPPSPTISQQEQQNQQLASTPHIALNNPFLATNQSSQPLDQSMQNLQISQPQHLFPNSTGGYGSQPHANGGFNPFLQSYTPPPMPQSYAAQNFVQPQDLYQQFVAQSQPQQQQQQQQQQPVLSQALNPFLRQSRSQVFQPTNPFDAQAMSAGTQVPFQQMPQQYDATFNAQQSHMAPFASTPVPTSAFSPHTTAGASIFAQQPASPPYGGTPGVSQSGFAAPPMPMSSPYGAQTPGMGSPFAPQTASGPFSAPVDTGAFNSQYSSQTASPSLYGQQQSNPFQQTSPLQQNSPFQPQQSQFQQPQVFNQGTTAFAPSAFSAPSPFQSASQQQAFQYQQQTQQQYVPTQSRIDKSSILALYNMPYQAPSSNVDSMPAATAGAQQGFQAADHRVPQRSVTMPVGTLPSQQTPAAGSHNPFTAMPPSSAVAGAPAPMASPGIAGAPFRHGSAESVDFGAFGSGRQSPDAFAGLSARLQ